MTTHTLDKDGLLMAAKDSIFTYTGAIIRPLNPNPKDIFIEDIAHSLSNQCRWTGHTSKFYSVAEHSLLVASMLPQHLKLSGLLHDATEAYLADLARPIKHAPGLGAMYLKYEAALEEAIATRFDVYTLHEDALIKKADDQVLRREAHALMPENLVAIMPEPDPQTPHIECYSPETAKVRFLSMYRSLGGREL